MLVRNLASLAILFIISGETTAQEFPKPGAEHAILQKMVGDWDVIMDMNGQKEKCRATYKSICGGMWVESDFEGKVAGIPFSGHGVDGYDLAKKKYIGIWVDSMTSAPMHMSGDYNADKKTLTMSGETTEPDGSQGKFRTTTVLKSDDAFTFQMFMAGPDGQEHLAFTAEYSRAKK